MEKCRDKRFEWRTPPLFDFKLWRAWLGNRGLSRRILQPRGQAVESDSHFCRSLI